MSEATTKHTPGPWHVHWISYPNVDMWPVRVLGNDPEYPTVCTFGEGSYYHRYSNANACLIAAAPDLLAACERAIMALAANGAPNCEAAKECRAAIAKATGGAA